MTDAPMLPFRVRMIGLPPATFGEHERVEAGIQAGQDVVQSRAPAGESLEFAGELRLKADDERKGAPVFLGPYAHGPPSGRFLYVSWTGESGGERRMFRRMKLQLGGIGWEQVGAILRDPRAALVATVQGRDRRGGPACATVPLIGGGWKVESVQSRPTS